ncbi:MAG: glutamate racemase [Candidatus Tantalella remota]|nr:glutamate racemase [Candidatus Tantalella remota]
MRSLKNRPIGIFDSGIGGLTVARSIRKCLPEEDIIYFGDTARVPYGNKSKATIIRFAREIMAFMLDNKVKIVVVACNTASSLGLRSLKESYKTPVIGVIDPGVKEAARITETGRVGVIGTSSTVGSGAYKKGLKKVAPSARLFSAACPLFVPLVENRHINDKITLDIARGYLEPLKKKKIDLLILGCTHYPILKTVIKKVMGKVKLVDSSSVVAKEVKRILSEEDLRADRRRGKMKCFVSDDVEGFRKSAGIFLREKINVSKAVL